MCGIAGLMSLPGVAEAPAIEATRRMNDRMRQRGPDADGVWTSEGIAFGHRRLAILDLDPRADQPMVSADGRYSIVFNGEIYNFRDLRRQLQDDGVAFTTESDTEVLLALYALEGERMLPRLRGMFAFAIWDRVSRELFLARDPYGIKPLYYTETRLGLLFASQVKALIASGLVTPETESAGLAGFYLWGSVPEPWTLFRGVYALPAGHFLRTGADATGRLVCWHDIRRHWGGEGKRLPAGELQERVRQAVVDSVRAHLVSDVPVCVFLSGGIDSASLAGLAAGVGARIEGITIGFEEFEGRREDEVPVAAAIAAHFGLPHHVRRVSRAEFEQDVPRILDAMDQPSVDGVNTWFASKAASERGYKVVLSGVGGDELFCGYSNFRTVPRAAAFGRAIAAVPGARALLGASSAYLARALSQPKLCGAAQLLGSVEGAYLLNRSLFLPSELPALMGGDMAREGLERLGGSPPGMSRAFARDGTAAVGLLESTHYLRNQLLRDGDWASMAHSLELRTPLVDATLLEALGPFVSGFARGVGKVMLARSPNVPIPDSIVQRPKLGFSVPMVQWLSGAMDRLPHPELPPLSAPGAGWARRWAWTLASEAAG